MLETTLQRGSVQGKATEYRFRPTKAARRTTGAFGLMPQNKA